MGRLRAKGDGVLILLHGKILGRYSPENILGSRQDLTADQRDLATAVV